MRDAVFDNPVTIDLAGTGRREIVARASQAAELLSERWPRESRGLKYRVAVRACAEAVRQRTAVDDARKALVEAAREARILVQERKSVTFGRRGT
jgi:hypothetical protein